jgi:uracil-DNA glycosylase family 4
MSKSKKKKDTDAPPPITWLPMTQTIGDKIWLKGKGSLPCDVMVIAEHPKRDDVRNKTVFSSQAGKFLMMSLKAYGLNIDSMYFTYLCKYSPDSSSIKAGDVSASLPLLQAEIKKGKPGLIITLGNHALKAVMGRKYKLSEYKGTVLEGAVTEENEDGEEEVVHTMRVFPMYNPGYILRKPSAKPEWDADLKMLQRLYGGKTVNAKKARYTLAHTVEEVRLFSDFLFEQDLDPLVFLDCEWHGENYMAPGSYIRTVQLGYDEDSAFILEFFDENKECMCTKIVNGEKVPYMELPAEERLSIAADMYKELKKILEAPNTRIGGQNVRADGHWLLWCGIDIRKNTVADTMITEHTIDGRGPFGLTDLTVLYTDMGRYDADVVAWREAHKEECEDGYGKIPRDILLPYAAADVVAPRIIHKQQMEKVKKYREKRGKYPSLHEVDLDASKTLYELERVGLLVDKEQLAKMTELYRGARDKVESMVRDLANQLDMPDFNPNSVHDVRDLLFSKERLGMTPLKTTKDTGQKPWDWVLQQSDHVQRRCTPATDKDVLSILADQKDAHPIVAKLRDYRKVNYVCNNWLVTEETSERFNTDSRGGGLLSKIWPDGRLHARFSQLKETARFGSAKPNV